MIDIFFLIIILKLMTKRSQSLSHPRKVSRGRPRKVPGAGPSADQMERLRFIERAALWTGKIGRRAVAATFDISLGHVSTDFQQYSEMAPRNLSYDVREKCYCPTDVFEPIFEMEESSKILSVVAATAVLSPKDRTRILGFDISVAAVQTLPTAIDQSLLIKICRAITAGAAVKVEYQSMSTPHPVARSFAPHALIYSGQRWLARGWDDHHKEFRDLALARILNAKMGIPVSDLPRDDQWHDRASIKLIPQDELSAGQKTVTAKEFGMRKRNDGIYEVEINPRQSMVPYILDLYRLRPSDPSAITLPIRLQDYSTLQQFDRRPLQR